MLQHRLPDLFPVGRAFELLPLVVKVAAFRQADANLDAAFRKVDIERDQSETLLLGAFREFVKLSLVNEQLASSFWLVVHQVGLRVFVDVCSNEPQLAATDARVSLFDRNLGVADTLYFAADQRDPAFQFVDDVVLVSGLTVRTDVLRVRIVDLFFLFTLLAGHLDEFTVRRRSGSA